MVHHTIEVSGEANPLSPQNVLHALVLAASTAQQQVQTGTQQLQNWEKQPMYYSFLQDVFLDHSVPNEVRYLAIIQLKNGIDKYWRKTAANAIKKEEKEKIKTRALEAGMVEPASLLALHNSLMIAKIMRYEFPHDWYDIEYIEIFHVLGSIYVDKVNQWTAIMEQGGVGESVLIDAIEQSLVSLKVIRRLVISGYEHPSRNQEVRDFWVLTHSHFSKFLSFVGVEKHLLQMSKLHVEMAKTHPASFALLPDSIPLVKSYWTLVIKLGDKYDSLGADSESDGKSLVEKTGLRALLLIRACAKMAFNPAQTFKYQTPQDKEERKQAVELIKSQLFTQDFVVNVMELLVTKFFRFRNIDFQEWEEEPEEWEKREDEISDAWEFSIRSCSEKLFLDLVIHFRDLLIPRLLSVFYNFASEFCFCYKPARQILMIILGPENRDVLLKDSLYSAIGLASASLEQHLDFNAFLEQTMVPEVQIQDQEYKVIRRRVAIVLGQWVPVKPGEVNRNAIYQIFQHLLNKQDPLNDLVVRITAGRQLRNVLDPYEFSPTEFMPFAPTILENLMALVQEVESTDTKMGLLETVRVAVVKLEDHVCPPPLLSIKHFFNIIQIAPFSDQILSLLPPLWESSGEEHLMKQAILTLLSSLIRAMKQESVRYHSIIIPLIQSSVEPGSETLVYLLDEALDLWSAIVAQTPAPASPEIISLLPALFPILEHATDSAPQALQIIESYILLAPQEVLSDRTRFHLLASLEALLKSTTKQRLGVVPRLVEMMIRGAETVDGGSEATYSVISHSLVNSSFLSSLLEGLHSAYEASQTTGPHRKTSSVVGIVETDYFSVLARLGLANPSIFASAIATATNSSQEQTLSWLLTEWFLHYDNIGSVTQKKLHALALTQLLALQDPPSATGPPPPYILAHLQSYMTIWTDIILELSEGGTDSNADYLVCWNAPPGSAHAPPDNQASDEPESPEARRRRDWDSADVVHRFAIRDFVRHRLQELIVSCGGADRFQEEWLVNVDREVVSAFGALGLL
ncbi:hypothetical protein N7474_004028 [Penicillium riverlandense]|uniref:uncharacterized protein n=1 Tax=Penicillium riverlandense TaxID=1903569 RepID=UPI00254663CC|nr:uncharacterized protein N7474_004028 [Penicillium riverlandense]KAJ5818437.1 hypothetical protein N7474_004028 [Penicillium riverlandense]